MATVRLAFIGAGEVNFGSPAVPWNHAQRLETLSAKYKIEVVGIADVNEKRAQSTLETWQGKSKLYGGAKAYGDYVKMLDETKPHGVLIGVPPFAHGSPEENKGDIEVVCARRNVAMFIEKPISLSDPKSVAQVLDEINKAGDKLVVSVGYMFRYAAFTNKINEILNGLAKKRGKSDGKEIIKAVLLRYNAAYAAINKSMWWDIRLSGGPIVEQSTHFVDIARYLAGEIDEPTLQAYSIRCEDLQAVPLDFVSKKNVEEGVKDENKIKHVTTAVWKFKSGALCSFTHAALYQGEKYECAIEIWGDGFRISVEDPYNHPVLKYKITGQDAPEGEAGKEQVFDLSADDPYESELDTFLSAISNSNPGAIRSPYADALGTYRMTWQIREKASS